MAKISSPPFLATCTDSMHILRRRRHADCVYCYARIRYWECGLVGCTLRRNNLFEPKSEHTLDAHHGRTIRSEHESRELWVNQACQRDDIPLQTHI